MSPPKAKNESAKAAKMGGKEFEDTFKPHGKDAPAIKKLEEPEKKKKGFPKALLILMILIVLLAGGIAALYFTGNLTKILASAGFGPVSPSPSVSASASPDTSASPTASDTSAGIQPSANGTLGSSTTGGAAVSPGTSAAPGASASPTQSFETVLTGLSTEKLTEFQKVGSIYSKMDPASAAKIMTKMYDTTQIAVIIYYMQPAAAASLLAALDPALAASVTQLMAT